ncbi:MAG: TadE family protein [Pseudomonadota bacterium]
MRRARRFSSDARGAAALEFAIVGPVFIALIMSLFELGLMMFKISMVDLAVSQATKFIYTGAVQSGTPTQEEIGEFICSRAVVLRDCENNITVELTAIGSFNAPPENDAPCVDSRNPDLNPTVAYDTGSGSQIMFMRVCVTTDVLTPGLGLGLALNSTDTDRAQIVSSVAFMNEPF